MRINQEVLSHYAICVCTFAHRTPCRPHPLYSFDVIRMIPALNISEAEMKQALDIFSEAVNEVVAAANKA